MEVIRITDSGVETEIYQNLPEIKDSLRRTRYEFFPTHIRSVSFDMDGVVIHDDSCHLLSHILGGEDCYQLFRHYSRMNIKAMEQGETAYCWYAPGVFLSQLLDKVSVRVVQIIAQHIRILPGAYMLMNSLRNAGVQTHLVTAGYQEIAEYIASEVNIDWECVHGIQVEKVDDIYIGKLKRFIGGEYKAKLVKSINGDDGIHVGDGYSDIESIQQSLYSIAFNPSCFQVLANAKISVIGVSLLPLVYLLVDNIDAMSAVHFDQVPQKLIIIDTEHPPEAEIKKILAASLELKHGLLNSILDHLCTYDEIMRSITAELNQQGVQVPMVKNLISMPDEEFDAYARTEYKKFFS